MPPPINHKPGTKFGRLSIIKRSGRCGFWVCRCECGNIKEVSSGNLNSGSTKSCGCLVREVSNICNQTFGYLKVKEFVESKNKHTYWKCICVCGNEIISTTNNLRRGNTKSCGCKSSFLQENTNKKRYGTKSSFQNERVRKKFEKTNIEKYGVPYPAQNPEISLKTAKSQKDTCTLKHWFSGEEIVCTAGWEKKVVEYFNDNKIDYNWQVQTFLMPDGKTYRPDCYLPDEDKWVEIKGYFRENAKKKWNWFHKEYQNSELWDKSKLTDMGIL